jgi:hypothetical protein
MTMPVETLHAVLLAIVVPTTALALVVDAAVVIGWIRRRWR